MPWAWEQPACRSSSFFFHCISPQIWSHRSTWLIRQILRTNFASLRRSPDKTFSNCGAVCPSDELAYGTGDVRAGKLTFGRKSHIVPSGRLPPRNGTAMGARHAAENRERVRVQLCELKLRGGKKKKRSDGNASTSKNSVWRMIMSRFAQGAVSCEERRACKTLLLCFWVAWYCVH